MTRKSILLVILLSSLSILASGCSEVEEKPTEILIASSPTAESIPPTEISEVISPSPESTAELRPFAPPLGEALPSAKNEYFTAAGNCVLCHRFNIDEAGNDVSIGEDWRGAMMAHSAVDPYYQAGVSMNLARFPDYDEAIQSKCSTCHMPMAHTSGVFSGNESPIFGSDGYLDPGNTLYQLARDGVSCTACHQIQNQGLGEFESFSGGFMIDSTSPMGARDVFGRFDPLMAGQRMMTMSSGFLAQRSDHIIESEICATCHNLYTQYVTQDGSLSEDWFPEQTPYNEWLHSDFATRSSCQDCHMPPAEGGVVLSTMGPAVLRSPFAQHSFVGGNAYMLGVLQNFGGELGVQAGLEHLNEAIERTHIELGSNTAELALSQPELDGTTLSFDVTTTVLTGHKFPTGYPSRRAWLHITVRDGEGEVIFESGAFGEDGAILGNANDQGSQEYESHYQLINSPDQVQIYETILSDVEGQLTTVLLAAYAYQKDNRLLPAGFDKATAETDIRPQGEAFDDEDFSGGGDKVRYQVELGGTAGPYTVEAELLYQSISYHWAMDLRAYDTEQVLIFSEYYDATPNIPVLVAEQVQTSE